MLLRNDIILLTSYGEINTQRFGAVLGLLLKQGSVVAITGPLGVGKTYLVKGIAEGLGVNDSRMVTSPTFTIVNEYNGRMPIYHIDVYRLTSINDMYDLGTDDMLWGNGVTIIEWADKVKECLPDDIININISYETESRRDIKMSSSGKGSGEILGQFRKKIEKLENWSILKPLLFVK